MPILHGGPRNATRGLNVFTFAPGHYGIAIRMINGTGTNSVKGNVVSASKTEDGKFILQANEYDAIGVVAESGIAANAECYVIISGIAEVLWKNSVAAHRGYVALSADTDGRAVDIDVPSSNPVVAEHFKEIGHVLENKDAGTNVLVRCILHFN